MKERSANTHLENILSKSFQEIDGSSHTCILTECYQSVILLICNFFVVNEPDILL